MKLSGKAISSECPASDNESILQPDHEYWYYFKTEALGDTFGASNDRSRMTLDCSVHILHTHDCFYQLKMEDCKLTATGGQPHSETAWMNSRKLSELSRFAIMFTLANGEIKNLYVDEKEPIFLVNIKRGALSAFVFKLSATKDKMEELHVDVHGSCPWHSNPTITMGNGRLKAYKDMQHCAFPSKPTWQLSPWSLFWNMSFIQQHINSTFECDYEVDMMHKTLEKLHCNERHAIDQQSTDQNTAIVQTNIHYHMTLEKSMKIESSKEYSLPTHRTNIIYEYEQTPNPEEVGAPHNFYDLAEKMLSDLVETSEEEVQLQTIPKFTDFVAWLRMSNDLLPFTKRVKDCSFLRSRLHCTDAVKELAMSYLSDAIVQCNTVPCFQALSDLAINTDLSDSYLNFVLYTWSYMPFNKPSVISHVKKICEVKGTRFCWLVLGTMVQNYHERNPSVKKPKELEEVTSYFSDAISMYCGNAFESVPPLDEEHYYKLMTNLKAIGNIGTVYPKYSPNGIQYLLYCIVKESLPMPIRITSLETLQKLDVCQNTTTCDSIYRMLKIRLMNPLLDVGFRIAIYDQLILTPEAWSFEKDLIILLQTERNSQVLSYVASDLSRRLDDAEFVRDHEKFSHTMTSLLKSHEISLYSLQNHRDETSKSSSGGSFFKAPFLPESLQGFGLKYQISKIFSFYNMVPQSLKTGMTIQLFNKVINLIQTNINIEGLNTLQPLFEKIGREIHGKYWSVQLLTRILATIEQYVTSEKSESFSYENYPFAKHIVDNIKKIHDLYQKHHPLSKRPFDFDISMFGKTLNIFTSKDFQSLKSWKSQIPFLLDNLKQGITYNHTRVIRIIEASHRVPTMMGLSLNWTTNAILAFSSRKGLTLSFAMQDSGLDMHGNGFFQPSIAFTFLNRMVLDFPTITQIGVQVNSSAFTSTQWKARIDYSDANNQRLFAIEAPHKTQNLFEFYQTSQLIKHNNYENIPDSYIPWKSASWSSFEPLSSVLGFEIWHERSHPEMANSIMPWAITPVSCKWILQARPHDKNLRTYNFNLKKKEQELERETELIFDAPGSIYKREATLKITKTLDLKNVTVAMEIKELPQFSVVLSNIQLLKMDNKIRGQEINFEVKFTDNLKYNLVYNHENNILAFNDGTTEKNKLLKSKMPHAIVQETTLDLETPHNIYKYNHRMHIQEKNIKVDASATYQNHRSEGNWLQHILPPNVWDSDRKAWIRLQFNSQGHSSKTITCRIAAPKSSVQVTSSSLHNARRNQLNISLTKTDSANQLLSFANFTYDLWTSVSDASHVKQVQLLNLTLPQISWSFRKESVMEDSKTLYDIALTHAQMKPKSDIKENEYVGWWAGHKNKHDLLVQEFKFKADIDSKIIDSSELLEKVPTLKEDLSDLNNRLILADVVFSYPLGDREESVNFHSYFIISNSEKILRYEKSCNLRSSYHNAILDSHSVYQSENNDKLVSHVSSVTHVGSETKAFYNLNYKKIYHASDCFDTDFSHSISSHVVDFASNFSYHCDTTNPEMKTLLLYLDSNSSVWDKLNAQMRQIINGTESYSYESVNFTHPLLTIEVVADWHENRHTKKAIFTKTSDKLPALILNLDCTIPWTTELVYDIPNKDGKENKIIYERKIMDNFRWFQIDVHFPDKQHEALALEGQISNPHKRIWTIEVFPKALELFNFLKDIGGNFATVASSIAEDPDHPLNQILKPALKMPLARYLIMMKQEVQNNVANGWNYIKSAVSSLEPIYETPIYILTRLSAFGAGAMKYFKLQELFPQGITNRSQVLNILKNMVLSSDKPRKFVFNTGSMFYWKSYKQLPLLASHSPYSKQKHPKPHHHRFVKSKVAMIYGPRHVYTFDGLLYEFASYPSEDCAFLLAHDAHQSKFSVLSTASGIHMLFAEMSISVDSQGHIYINGTQKEQSVPLQSMNRNIFVKREGKILKISSPAIRVFCDIHNELCALELNAWNGGGIIGLLGNADGEKLNDYMVPDGSIASDMVKFAAPYELSGNSQCQNLQQPQRPAYVPEHASYCKEKLQVVCDSYENSKKYFYSSCLSNMKDNENGCPSITALSTLCYFNNEPMISTCDVPKQESENIRQELEVVLIVNEHMSMLDDGKDSFVKGVESVANAIYHEFQLHSYINIRYSVIGFGGIGVHFHPSIHAVNDNIWVSHEIVADLLKTLDFKGTAHGDPVAALRYALEVLGHNTFNSKVIVIFTDQDKQGTKKSMLHSIRNYLKRNSITLFAVASYPTIEKEMNIFGIRADGLRFPSLSKDTEAYLDYPCEDLAKLVFDTRGSLFLKRFVRQNGPLKFFMELAQGMWARVYQEVKYCRRCKIMQSGWWYFYNECILTNC